MTLAEWWVAAVEAYVRAHPDAPEVVEFRAGMADLRAALAALNADG